MVWPSSSRAIDRYRDVAEGRVGPAMVVRVPKLWGGMGRAEVAGKTGRGLECAQRNGRTWNCTGGQRGEEGAEEEK
jgi:hypothetical protein